MRRAAFVGALVFCACPQTRSVELTFGERGEGLDGFLCKDNDGTPVLTRVADAGVPPDGGTLLTADGGIEATLVFDFVDLGGVPGCRASQLIEWCGSHDCKPIEGTRRCLKVTLPSRVETTAAGAMDREATRAKVLEAIQAAHGEAITPDAPDKFVMLRMIATKEPCPASAFNKDLLFGCAYSCPVLFDKIEQEIYLGFDTLTASCAQGLRTCADNSLKWNP